MKKRKIVLLLAALFVITNTNAQFLKKLKKRAEQAAEEAVSRKIEEKTERETEKIFDTVFNNNGKLFKGEKAKVEDNYMFSHEYVMEVISKNDTISITYYLSNEHHYMGNSFNTDKNEKFISVMDLSNSAIHTFMDMGNQKTMTSMRINLNDVDEKEMNTSKFHIASTGQTKKIIGYLCEEFQITGSKLSGKVWVTQEADISFQKVFSQKKSKQRKGLDQSWLSMVDGLVLEMKMIDYSRKKPKPIIMTCTKLQENAFSIQTSEYQN